MHFKYLDNAEQNVGFLDHPAKCDICGIEKPCFDAEGFYGEESLTAICSDCLVAGKINERDIFTCVGDGEELERQLKQLYPGYSQSQLDAVVKQKTDELEKTTPQLVTWQDWNWPCCDGDYCKFLGYGSKALYNKLDLNGNGQELFVNSFYYTLKDLDTEDLWTDALPDPEVKSYKDSSQYSTLFYVFKSLNSEKIITIWDCD